MYKYFKYRLYPNKAQERKLLWTFGRCRELYNAALQERREAWKMCRKSISRWEQNKDLVAIKELRPEYQEIGAHVLANVIYRVDLAFQSYFRRVKAGEKPGYPRYQGKNRYDSFTYPDGCGWKLEVNQLRLSKIGSINVKLHRLLEGTIKTTTIKREGEQWYVYFACEVEPSPHLPHTDEAIGVDLGLLHFATLSTGDTIENPRYLRKSEKKLAKLQQSLARKKRGSNRRKKAKQAVAKAHRKVRNQRKDFLHKQSRQLVSTYETIVFEELDAANLSKRPKPKQDEETGQYLPNGASAKAGLNKSIRDAGWSKFVELCRYKAASAGTTILQVNPRYTSQICSGCGQVKKKELSERWHRCDCGTELDRDHNAAINILRAGRVQQEQSCRAS